MSATYKTCNKSDMITAAIFEQSEKIHLMWSWDTHNEEEILFKLLKNMKNAETEFHHRVDYVITRLKE